MTLPALAVRLRPRGFAPTPADIALKRVQQTQAVKELWIVIASVVGFLFVVRVLRYACSRLFGRRPSNTGKVSWRRIPAAAAATFRIVAFRLAFTWGYIGTILGLTFVDTKDLTTWFYEDRAAHLASCQLPLIVALAGKNNIISWITGIGHEKLNVLHRAAARTCLLLLWLHALNRALGGCDLSDSLQAASTDVEPASPGSSALNRMCGCTGSGRMTAFTLATILSLRFIRNAFFEYFLISHIVLVGLFIISGYLHARAVEYGDYFWPALVVWAFDRLLRASRLVWNNRARRGTHEYGSALVELISPDTIRLTLRRKMTWRAGQHAYRPPTEAHPFSIASIPHALDGAHDGGERDVVFLVRGRSGFTGRLREFATRNHGTTRVPALIDGPYGCPPNLMRFSTCVLIAGGSGVSYTLPLLLDIVRNVRDGKSLVRRVIFVWAVRQSEHLDWISKTLNEALAVAQPTSLVVEPTVYVTGPSCTMPTIARTPYMPNMSPASDSGSTKSLEASIDKTLPSYSSLKVIHGRPSIRRVLQDGINCSAGPVSVDVSGPTALTQSVCYALSTDIASPASILKGSQPVTLHVETFGMSK
ncbi:ferric reductase NAD binding domain-containing protein [Epithele typhae]|uniref:ferric reductase NAD binding domain-containing protein n=1 Tax=Epithele typhae TaxID=378194 RepID=UPI002007FA93|nr:ferric reductase NAD binding domain-containing protein [Epithele typhae]KAH9943327.1 ferric reductase NAD binding domain-containing protein [Epithele typhae]